MDAARSRAAAWWPLTGASGSIGRRESGARVTPCRRRLVAEVAGAIGPDVAVRRDRLVGVRRRRLARSASSVSGHRPDSGGRFSAKAAMPSGLILASRTAGRSSVARTRGPPSSGSSNARLTASLAAITAIGGIAATRSARSSAASSVASAGTTRVTSPCASASRAVHVPPGQDQLHRLGLADRPCQPLRAAGAGHDPELDLRLAELRVLAGDDHVARHRELAAAAERDAADRRDERLADPLDPLPAVEVVVDE